MKKLSTLALILVLFGFITTEAANKCTITGAVSISSASFCSTLSDGDTLWIGSSSDTLYIDNHNTTYASTDLIIYIVDSGVVSWNANYTWSLGANTVLVMGNGGDLHAPSPCNANQKFRLGSSNIASCSGGNATFSFNDIINLGGYDPANPPVPVELMNFDYKVLDSKLTGSVVELNWKTASELNNDRFEIYKSNNGQEFELVQTVSGSGTSASISSYSVVDQVGSKDDNLFYKLVQIDFDGQTETFAILKVDLAIKKDVVIFPNPTNGTLNVSHVGGEYVSNVITLTNLSGQTVLTESLNSATSVDVSSIKPGVYFVRITSENKEVINQRLIIK
ncbi:MAG: hypothetical protein COA58_13225 [Bacteroidetes bacterium]|nr:MAG: hypothetical protein COA58_13225 [Bacteroidota bacterium]